MRRALAALVVLALCQNATAENRIIKTECRDGVCRRVFVGSKYENDVVARVNAERRSRGLRPLKVTERLMSQSRGWSGVMARQRKMYHSQAPGVGENVAYGQRDPAEVMHAWMNSPGHRKNILNPNYSEIGVGAVANGRSIYWTQMFK